MRYIKFWANMLLIPVYVILFFAIEIPGLIRQCYGEIYGGIKDTKRKYGID